MAPPLSVHPRILACFRSASTIDSVVLEWRAARPVKNVATLAREALYALVEVTENGRRRRVSKLEVGFKQLANRIAKGDLVAIRLLLTIPGVQKELVELRSSRPLTPEAWERVASLVRGDLNPENEGPTAPRVGRRQPDISEVASRLRGALKNRR